MPKNKGKGGKNRRRGKNENIDETKRELIYKEDGQTYAQVLRILGGGNVEAICFNDDIKRICHIRGKMRKKIWINKSDIVLVGLRNFENNKADIILKYTLDEARELQKKGEISKNLNLSEAGGEIGQENLIDSIYFAENEIKSNSEASSDDDQDIARNYNREIGSMNKKYLKKQTNENENNDSDEFIGVI